MNVAKVTAKMPGPTSMAMLRTDPSAPCSSPCSDGETRWVIIDCDGGPANPHRQLIGIASRKSQVCRAQPKITNPIAPRSSPAKSVRRSPNRATTGPTTTAEVSIDETPTRASEPPIARSPQ